MFFPEIPMGFSALNLNISKKNTKKNICSNFTIMF